MRFINKIPVYIFTCLYPLKVYGKENIPEGSAVMVCNHFRAIDCCFIARFYNTDISFMAKKELFKNKFFGKIVGSFGAIPVDRDNPDIKSIMTALKVVKNGHKLVIFPEGTRNKSGTTDLQEIKEGTAMFAIKAKCPIVPMMMLKKAKFLRKTHIIIGKPFELSEFYDKKLTPEVFSEAGVVVRAKMIEQHEILRELIKNKKAKNKSKCK